MLKAYKYRILPTKYQAQQLEKIFGCVRFVFNLGLDTKKQAWSSVHRNLTYVELAGQMKELKDTEATWLQECPSQALQMSLRNLDNAYASFFRGNGYPKYKSKRGRQSAQFPQGVSVNFDSSIISLPKLKGIQCIFHRRFTGDIKTVTVSKTSTDKFFVSILVDNQKELPEKMPVQNRTSVGVDVGVKVFAALSDGTVFENHKFSRTNLRRLRLEQRKLSRRFVKGATEQSRSYYRQKMVVAKLNERIKNQREDFLHKVSTYLIRSFDTICLEDLNISGMMRNRRLSLAIGEMGWHKFRVMLEYKADWYGKTILYAGMFSPSSKTCSKCGEILKEITLDERDWTCVACNTHHDRDLNAAINIKNFGLRKQPSTVNVNH